MYLTFLPNEYATSTAKKNLSVVFQFLVTPLFPKEREDDGWK